MNHATYLRYSAGLERPTPQEAADTTEIVATMRDIAEKVDDRYRHAVRSVHAKNHGIAIGRLEIPEGLPPHLAQGLFARPGSYPVLARFSTNPGDLLPDSVSTARGLAIKIIGIEGADMVEGHEGESTQDLLFVDGPVLGAVEPGDFLKQIKLFDQHLGDPAEVKIAVSTGAQVANGVLSAFGKPSPLVAALGGHPPTHPLGARFFTQAPNRYGDYVAKLSLLPESEELRALANRRIDVSEFSALRNAIAEYFATNEGTWLLQAQLAVNERTTPIEDMSVEWKETDAPFETVARLTLPPQPTNSAERRVFADDRSSFDPWHALEAHRPLGGIQRARRAAYRALSDYRFDRNVRERAEPRSTSDLPA